MLAEEPLPPDLLAIAREVLLKDLLPALPPDKAFAARMVANAMAIAARSSEEGDAEARLAALASDARSLATDIRAGRFDPGTPQHGEAAALLDDITRARCLVSAPRALG
ncbi:hypothetical protein KPL78_28815 [Roseomonas sp. HJA6]|uniref:DUF6285 domain-containing protein n=1 Tax=Roseomonas alba TaxID=2846776 RepID=A0ABS7AJG9_9PROT|nr:DUF6285 domain-containing protein [Neoroseomonas alba]MBW6401882.1 hypothetical protein [Neoroseomonas alba]